MLIRKLGVKRNQGNGSLMLCHLAVGVIFS